MNNEKQGLRKKGKKEINEKMLSVEINMEKTEAMFYRLNVNEKLITFERDKASGQKMFGWLR